MLMMNEDYHIFAVNNTKVPIGSDASAAFREKFSEGLLFHGECFREIFGLKFKGLFVFGR